MASNAKSRIAEQARLGETLKDIFVLDCHGHIGPSFIHHIPGYDKDGMIKTMDRLGVDVFCISGEAGISCDHRVGNDLVADAVASYPDRYIGYASINPNHGEEAAEELERCFDTLGLTALKIHPTFHVYPADGPNYRPVWEFAASRGCTVLSHSQGGDPNATPSRFDGIAREFPDVPIIMGHAGNTWSGVEEAIEMAGRHDNIFLDLNFSTFYYGLVEDLVRRVSIEQLIFGSDASWNSMSYLLGIILCAKISDTEKIKILGENAAPLFGIKR
jgi:hypothetical protein